MGWLITFAILFLIAWIPLGVGIRYDAEGFCAKVILGAARITVFPVPRWMKRSKKKDDKPEKPAKKKTEKKEKSTNSGGSLLDFMPFVKLGLDFLNTFRKKLRINRLILNLTLASDDPCDLAVNYGRTWAAAGNLVSALERVFAIKKREVEVGCDFTADSTTVCADIALTITVGRLLAMGFVYGLKAFKEYKSFKKKREKAVQTQ